MYNSLRYTVLLNDYHIYVILYLTSYYQKYRGDIMVIFVSELNEILKECLFSNFGLFFVCLYVITPKQQRYEIANIEMKTRDITSGCSVTHF